MFADMKDATLEAQADFTEVIREVMGEVVLPQIKMMAMVKWAQMSDEDKERFKSERPNEYRALMEGTK